MIARKSWALRKTANSLNVWQKLFISTKQSTITDNNAYSPIRNATRMKAWQIHSYSDLSALEVSPNIKIPTIRKPSEVIVKVIATSVNPIDVAMVGGYGSSFLNVLRCNRDIEFPLILGRDFSGTVVNKGLDVSDKDISIGDSVWGVVPVQDQGCHAEYVKVDSNCITKKPKTLSDEEASGVLYSGLTAWSGLFLSGQLCDFLGIFASATQGCAQHKRVLVLGASGGVGTMAIQILLAEGAQVVATCSNDAMPMIQSLGVDLVVDYADINSSKDLVQLGPYDIILDCAGKGPDYASSLPWTFNHYVTFTSPTLKHIDEHGFPLGMARNVVSLAQSNIKAISTQQGFIKWGYFIPANRGIQYLTKLANKGKLKPVIQEVYNFSEANEAYTRVENGHLRGKVIISMNSIV